MSSDAAIAKIIDQLLALPEDEQLKAVRALTAAQRREFFTRWSAWAHGGQLAPPGGTGGCG